MKFLKVFILLLFLSGSLYSQTNYFYTGKNYGSESTFNPVSVILNGGFDIFQVERNRDLRSVTFYAGLKNVYNNIVDPI